MSSGVSTGSAWQSSPWQPSPMGTALRTPFMVMPIPNMAMCRYGSQKLGNRQIKVKSSRAARKAHSGVDVLNNIQSNIEEPRAYSRGLQDTPRKFPAEPHSYNDKEKVLQRAHWVCTVLCDRSNKICGAHPQVAGMPLLRRSKSIGCSHTPVVVNHTQKHTTLRRGKSVSYWNPCGQLLRQATPIRTSRDLLFLQASRT